MIPDALLVAIQLTRGVRAKGPLGRFAKELLPLLERSAKELERAPTAVLRTSRRTNAEIEYVVMDGGNGEMLVEHRFGGTAQPFRCPQLIYTAAVDVLATTTKPLASDEIMTEIESATGVRPAEFQLRVILRFWLNVNPPLIFRFRARYRPLDSSQFREEAVLIWDRLRHS